MPCFFKRVFPIDEYQEIKRREYNHIIRNDIYDFASYTKPYEEPKKFIPAFFSAPAILVNSLLGIMINLFDALVCLSQAAFYLITCKPKESGDKLLKSLQHTGNLLFTVITTVPDIVLSLAQLMVKTTCTLPHVAASIKDTVEEEFGKLGQVTCPIF